jgi:hypothetical protein
MQAPRSNASFDALVTEGKKAYAEFVKAGLLLLGSRSLSDSCLAVWKKSDRAQRRAGHGNWYIWLPANFPELGPSEITRLNSAKRYMKSWKENQSAQIRGIPNDLKAEELFSSESIRKFMWTYVPTRER